MDIQLKKKPWFVRHKYYVSGGIVFLSLAAYTVALLFSPEKQRVSADTLGLAEAVQADFLEYVEQINANIGMIDRNSTITVRGRNLKMLRIQVPGWETEKEHFRLKLHDYCLLYTSDAADE